MIGDDTPRTMADQPAATAGGRGPEPCRDCRAPLVPGQRYCLYCGTRCPEARLEFLDVLVEDAAGLRRPAPSAPGQLAGAAASAGGAPAWAASREPGVNGWLRRHSPILGLTGLLLVTLLIGLLIGHWATNGSSDATAKVPPPQIIRVQSSGATAAAAGAAAAGAKTGSSASSGSDASSAAKHSSSASAAKHAKQEPAASSTTAAKAAKPSAAATKAPANAVNTDSLAGKDKEKAIEKAAKKGQPIATGDGKLPPTDDKAPAGGAGFETIG